MQPCLVVELQTDAMHEVVQWRWEAFAQQWTNVIEEDHTSVLILIQPSRQKLLSYNIWVSNHCLLWGQHLMARACCDVKSLLLCQWVSF